MDERTLREYYTEQFRQIIQQAHPGSVMSSYNEINGIALAGQRQAHPHPGARDVRLRRLLHLRLRRHLRGRSTAITGSRRDSPAGQPVTRHAYALSAGEDLDCNQGYNDGYRLRQRAADRSGPARRDADGHASENDLDISLVRLFTARMKLGEFDAAPARCRG